MALGSAKTVAAPADWGPVVDMDRGAIFAAMEYFSGKGQAHVNPQALATVAVAEAINNLAEAVREGRQK